MAHHSVSANATMMASGPTTPTIIAISQVTGASIGTVATGAAISAMLDDDD